MFSVGEELEAGCELSTEDGELSEDARLSSGVVRTAEWNGGAWLLQGSGASAKLRKLRPGTGDRDGDGAADEIDVFPLDPVTSRDWDHDGIDDENDAAPTDAGDWQDSDGDKVADNKDAFPDNPKEWKDSDEDGVGDHADAFPDDPERSLDTDSDGVDDESDAFAYDPLEQSDSDEDEVGDNAERDPPFGAPTAVFDLQLKVAARLAGFEPSATTTNPLLILYDNDRFKICELADCLDTDSVSGTFQRKGRTGKTLKLHFDVRSLSKLLVDFAFEASALVPREAADPRTSPYFFVPKAVDSAGVAKLTRKGVTLALRARFSYKREPRFSAGWKGAFVYRAKGVPVELPAAQ